jgi:hypothetical protein
MAIGPIPRGWGRWVGLAGASAYSFWWRAAHGCWSWRDDGREGVRRAFVVLDLGDRPAAAVRALVTVRCCRARSIARRLPGNLIDLAAGRPLPRKIPYHC